MRCWCITMSWFNIDLPLGRRYSDRFMLRNGLLTVSQWKCPKTYSPLCMLVPIMLTENYFHFIPINFWWNGKWEITSQNEKQSICQPPILSIKLSVPSTATTDHKFFYKSHTKNSSVQYKCVLAIWITNILSANFDGNNLSIWSNEG